MSKELVAIVLPMYNEELSIPFLKKMFNKEFYWPSQSDYRLLAVNDGSSDNTLELIKDWASEDEHVFVISHLKNMGVGQAILTGFHEAINMGASFVVTLDADASHPGSIIAQMVEKGEQGADIVIASRFAAGGKQVGVPPLRQVYSLGARVLLSAFFPLKGVKDYTVGFRLYRVSMLKKALLLGEDRFLKFRSFATSVEILLKVATQAERIEEVPLLLRYDYKLSPSKLRLWLTIRDYLRLFLLPKEKCSLGKGLKIN